MLFLDGLVAVFHECLSQHKVDQQNWRRGRELSAKLGVALLAPQQP